MMRSTYEDHREIREYAEYEYKRYLQPLICFKFIFQQKILKNNKQTVHEKRERSKGQRKSLA